MFAPGNGVRSGTTRVGVLISNANSVNRIATFSEADKARRANINLVTVGVTVGSWLDVTELQAIASYPTDKTTFIINGAVGAGTNGGYSLLSGVRQQISDLACGSTLTQVI